MSSSELVENTRKIWEEALKIPVKDTTDFFWEGGHSFMALDIIVQTGEVLHAQVPLRLLFDHSRFDDFVAALEDLIHAEKGQ